MTSRARVLAALEGGAVDRLPHYTPFVSGDFRQRWLAAKRPPAGTTLEAYYQQDVAVLAADETPFRSQNAVLEDGPAERLSRDGWGRVVRERKGAMFYEVVSGPTADGRDMLDLAWEDPRDPERYVGFDAQVAAAEAQGLAAFAKIGGPFLRTTFVRGEADYLMDIAADPSYARQLAERMADHLLGVALESLRRGGGRLVGMSMFDDIAYNSGPFISLKSFEQVFLPAYARIVGACREAGARHFLFHSDGDIRPLLPYLADIGVDMINPIEPRAGMDVLELRETYDGRLAFLGGLDNSGVMCFGTPDEVRAHVAPVARAARERGGIICGMHSIESDVPLANYEAYYETVMNG